MQNSLTSCVVASHRQRNSATASGQITTVNATETQQKSLKSLAENILERNQRNQQYNFNTTGLLQTNALQQPPQLQHQLIVKLKHLIKKVSDNYGGDEEEFLQAYINITLIHSDINDSIRCFSDLSCLLKTENNRS